MRPDRIIVGEVRGAETLDMLQAMNTGHEGSLTTIHANTPRDALSRLETLVMTGGVELPHRAIREQIASAFDLLVQIQRLVDGTRRVTHISEVLGMESDVITLQDIFVASAPTEEDAAPDAQAADAAAAQPGLKPHFLDRLAANNVVLPPTFFGADDNGRARGVLGRGLRGLGVKRIRKPWLRMPSARARGARRSPAPAVGRPCGSAASTTSSYPELRVTVVGAAPAPPRRG